MRAILCGVVLATAVAACSGDAPQVDPAANAAATRAAAAPADDTVAAVLQSAGSPVAQLRFALESRPEPGVPFTLRLVVSAATALPELFLSAESATLTVQDASAVLALSEAGATATHEVTLTASEEELAEVSVRLRADVEQPETVYVIPVLIAKPAAAG